MTEAALDKAIEAVRPGARVSDIGAAVQAHVEAHGFSVVREFVGHGIGTKLHEEPQIPNYGPAGPRTAARRRHGARDRADGERGQPAVKVLSDGWTAVTKDGSLSAHFEHTVVVTGTRLSDPDRCERRRERSREPVVGTAGSRVGV